MLLSLGWAISNAELLRLGLMFVKPPTSSGGRIDLTPRRRMREKHASQLLEEWSSGLTDVQLQRFWTVRLGKRWLGCISDCQLEVLHR